ncbi:MAG: hypothetical protein C1O27_002571, partial [Chloroflexi bacterium]
MINVSLLFNFPMLSIAQKLWFFVPEPVLS